MNDGVFYAELNEFLTRELAEQGYAGVEVRVTPMRTEIIIRATRTQDVLGESWVPVCQRHVGIQSQRGYPERQQLSNISCMENPLGFRRFSA